MTTWTLADKIEADAYESGVKASVQTSEVPSITKHFAIPPYKALPSGGANAWWYVANAQGFNCLHFDSKPGAKFTSESIAKSAADRWNMQ